MKSKEEDFVLWPPTTWKPIYHDDGGGDVDDDEDEYNYDDGEDDKD